MKIKFNTLETGKNFDVSFDNGATWETYSKDTTEIEFFKNKCESLDDIICGKKANSKPTSTNIQKRCYEKETVNTEYVDFEELSNYLSSLTANDKNNPYSLHIINVVGSSISYSLKSSGIYIDLSPTDLSSMYWSYSAFEDCTYLTSITIPDIVTSINYNTFGGCSSLTSITIPEGVTFIGEGAFYNCKSLTEINIPDSVTSIGQYAFNNCTSLTSINYTGTEEQWNAISKSSNWNKNVAASCVINYNYSA